MEEMTMLGRHRVIALLTIVSFTASCGEPSTSPSAATPVNAQNARSATVLDEKDPFRTFPKEWVLPTQQAAASPPTAISSSEDIRTRCHTFFGSKTYKGLVKNGYPVYVNGNYVWYTFSTEGSLVLNPDGTQGCLVKAHWKGHDNKTGNFTLRFNSTFAEARNPNADPDRWIRFTPQPDGTLIRTGQERVVFGSMFDKPLPGTTNIYSTGTITFYPEK